MNTITTFHPVQLLEQSNKIRVSGTCTRVGETLNKRFYSKEVVASMYAQGKRLLAERKLLCSVGHPQNTDLNNLLGRFSLWEWKDATRQEIIGTVDVVKGSVQYDYLRNLIAEKYNVGFSTRATGEVELGSDGVQVVKDIALDAVDLVLNPAIAQPVKIQENFNALTEALSMRLKEESAFDVAVNNILQEMVDKETALQDGVDAIIGQLFKNGRGADRLDESALDPYANAIAQTARELAADKRKHETSIWDLMPRGNEKW